MGELGNGVPDGVWKENQRGTGGAGGRGAAGMGMAGVGTAWSGAGTDWTTGAG
ncbi:MAG: hypothetical protein HQM01_03460, partial [Magnetococcales bacterium]|nr:hypothetical protein [Magnetococcales bacterium]